LCVHSSGRGKKTAGIGKNPQKEIEICAETEATQDNLVKLQLLFTEKNAAENAVTWGVNMGKL